MTTKQERQTRKVELVEANNICNSIKRIKNVASGWDDKRWRRSLYTAMGMAGIDRSIMEKVRIALELP